MAGLAPGCRRAARKNFGKVWNPSKSKDSPNFLGEISLIFQGLRIRSASFSKFFQTFPNLSLGRNKRFQWLAAELPGKPVFFATTEGTPGSQRVKLATARPAIAGRSIPPPRADRSPPPVSRPPLRSAPAVLALPRSIIRTFYKANAGPSSFSLEKEKLGRCHRGAIRPWRQGADRSDGANALDAHIIRYLAGPSFGWRGSGRGPHGLLPLYP